ncbi:choice-of-anchor D domain-containing protein, partial [Thermodesulfovibrionales bacterium]|nr:choice-of-anchor D domain-containing protein [Thermodesulfovibrionales bacterium]
NRSVSGTGTEPPPLLSVTPDPSLDFGSVIVTQSHDLDFTVTNTGGGTLTGEAALPAGSPFSIVSGSPFSIPAGQDATVTVRFSPAAVGSFSETVSFTSNGGDLTRGVSGTGVPPGVPVLSVTPDPSLDFGNIIVGESRDLDFTVTNTGGGTLTGSATVPAVPFSIVGASDFSLVAGASTTVTVRFSPTAAGSFSETVSFTSNGGDLTRTVIGTGVPPAPVLSITPIAITASLEEGTGWTDIGTINVTNPGEGTLNWSATDDRVWLEVTPTSGTTTAETDSVTVRATTVGLTVGTHTGTITFTGAGIDPQTISVTLAVTEDEPQFGCFIATAAFGTPLAEEIDILREFRDEYLLTNELGQRFVAFYNRHSPALAEFIAEREAAKKVVRVALWPLVKIVEFIVGEEREVGAPKKSSDFLGDVVTEWPGALPASAEAQMGLCQSMGRMKE